MADEEPKPTAKSAEDRKAASALASLDAADPSTSHNVDQEAVNKAIKALSGAAPPPTTTTSKTTSSSSAASAPKKPAHKNVKVDAADVALLVDQLDLPRPRATELLKSHEGDAVKAMRAWVNA